MLRKKRDVYAVFSNKMSIPYDMRLGELKKISSVNIKTDKKTGGGYDIYVSKKPSSLFAYPHPVVMQKNTAVIHKKRGG